MAPSLRSVGTAALACIGSASAKQWYIHDTYDATNFFDKFDFFSDADPNSGHVAYKTQAEATELGIAKCENDEVYLGVDHTNVLDSDTGRPSVRLHSKTEFNHGLFIARFSHLPEPKCGSWPAFWSVGNTWPADGEIDLIEGWNLATTNKPAFHTGDSDELGTCMLDGENQTGVVDTDNCDNTYQNTPDQYLNEGCTVDDYDAPYGTSDGGVYALEWTDSFIKVFAWKWASVPDNLDSDEPNTDSWGTPTLYLKNDKCNIDDHFVDQTLIINIAFCGNPVGNDDIWAQACKAETSYDTCSEYVSAKPGAFENTYFKIQDIRYFKASKSASTSSAVASASSSVSSASASVSAPVSSTAYTTDATSTFATQTRAANTSIAITSTESVEMTTSVVYTTRVSTVTACPSSVTNCPVGSVVTETVVAYTTVCPVTAQATESGSSGSGSGSGDDSETITATITNVHTITSCAASVTNCPVGELSTEYITTTYCPGNGEGPAATTTGSGSSGSGSGDDSETITETITNVHTITSCAASVTNCPVGELSTEFITTTYCPGNGEGSSTTPGSGSDNSASETGFFPSPAPSGTPASGTPASYETPVVVSTPVVNTPIVVSTPVVVSVPVASSAAGSSAAAEVPTTAYVPATPSTTPVAAGSSSSSGSTASEVPVTGSAGKMSASLALILGAAAAMMM